MMNWISIEDHLPQENTEVLVYTSENKIYIASLVDSDFDDPFYYLWDINCYEHIIHTQDFSVKYWMPCPKPPNDFKEKPYVSPLSSWLCKSCGKWELKGTQMAIIGKCSKCLKENVSIFTRMNDGLDQC